MNFVKLEKPKNMELTAGKLLIAEPLLADPNFSRSVILLCDHNEEGSVGFVLNKQTQLTLGDLLPEIYSPLLNIYQGGPVQLDTLHMLHRMPVAYGGNEISPGIYWGGSYEALQESVMNNDYDPDGVRLFVGYSGWGAGQLEQELKEGSWIVTELPEDILFETDNEMIWKKAIRSLGNEFAYLENMPVNAQLN